MSVVPMTAAAWGRDGAGPLDALRPRPRGLGHAPVKGPCRARCRAMAIAGRVYPWTSSAAIVAGSYCHSRALADAGHRRAGCALNDFSWIGDVEVFDRLGTPQDPSRPHHLLKSTTTGWVNFVSSAAREVRSVLCAHMRQSQLDVPRQWGVLPRANSGKGVHSRSHTSTSTGHFSTPILCRRRNLDCQTRFVGKPLRVITPTRMPRRLRWVISDEQKWVTFNERQSHRRLGFQLLSSGSAARAARCATGRSGRGGRCAARPRPQTRHRSCGAAVKFDDALDKLAEHLST